MGPSKSANNVGKSPFEPMNKMFLKFLTWKTIFLTAVSTFMGCAAIQTLRTNTGFIIIVHEWIILFVKNCQKKPGHSDKRTFVPCLSKDKKVNPKRAVLIY